MVIMLGVTFTALALKIMELVTALSGQFVFGNALQLVFAVLLLILGVIVAFEGIKKLIGKDETAENEEAAGSKEDGRKCSCLITEKRSYFFSTAIQTSTRPFSP